MTKIFRIAPTSPKSKFLIKKIFLVISKVNLIINNKDLKMKYHEFSNKEWSIMKIVRH